MKKIIIVLFLISAFFEIGCSEYQKVLKGADMDKKYEMALKYYNKEDYFKALPLFEELISTYKGTRNAEKIYYHYAYCHYGLQDYATASFHFENFVKTFPNSIYAEECQFMNAYCYYLESPTYSLDQTNTYKAINELQLFINKYPQSLKIEQCNELIDNLRKKLETKAFDNAKLYYNTGNYKAAIYAFKNLIKTYPDTKYREESFYLILKSSFLYANNSVEDKKEERYKLAIDAYYLFIDSFIKSKYTKEAESMYDQSIKQIEKISIKPQNS